MYIIQEQNESRDAKSSDKLCSKCAGKSQTDSQNSASNDTPRKSLRREAERKSPDQEFFHMLLLSHIIAHPKKNLLIEMQTDQEKLYKQVRNSGKPFFEWNQWI